MPMLHGCAFPGCTTLTLSTYCVEHELLMRAMRESERTHGDDGLDPEPPSTAASEDATVDPAPLGKTAV